MLYFSIDFRINEFIKHGYLKDDAVQNMHDLNGGFDHDGIMQIRKRIFMGHSFSEKFVQVVVFDPLRHFLVEVTRLHWTLNLDVNLVLTFFAEFVFFQLTSMIRTKSLFRHAYGSHLFYTRF